MRLFFAEMADGGAMIDKGQAERFFEAMFGRNWAPNQLGIVTFKGLGREEKPLCHWAQSAAQGAAIAAHEAERANVYLTTCLRPPRAQKEFGRTRYGLAEDVVLLPGLWLDIDQKSPHRESSAVLPETEEECIEILDAVGLLPSAIIRSGYGLQPYWFLTEPLRWGDREGLARASSLSEAFTRRAVRLSKALGWDLDAKQSIASILRVPGTVNRKGGLEKAVEIESLNEKRRYRLEELEELCGEDLVEARRGAARAGAGTGRGSTKYSHIGPFELDPGAQPTDRFMTAVLNNDRLRLTWEWERPDLTKQSQSEYDMALAVLLIPMGFTDQEIVQVLIASRRVHDGRPPETQNYYQRTVGRAHELVDARKVADESEAAEIEEALEDEPEKAIALLRKKLQIPVSGFLQRGRSPAFYYLVLDGHGEIRLGTSKSAMSANGVREAVWDSTGMVVPRRKAPAWDGILKLLSRIKRIEEIPEGDRTEVTLDWIESHASDAAGRRGLPDRARSDEEGQKAWKDAVLSKDPFVDGVSKTLHVNTTALQLYLRVTGAELVSSSDLRTRLSELGFKSEQVQVWRDERNHNRRYWTCNLNGRNGHGPTPNSPNSSGSPAVGQEAPQNQHSNRPSSPNSEVSD